MCARKREDVGYQLSEVMSGPQLGRHEAEKLKPHERERACGVIKWASEAIVWRSSSLEEACARR